MTSVKLYPMLQILFYNKVNVIWARSKYVNHLNVKFFVFISWKGAYKKEKKKKKVKEKKRKERKGKENGKKRKEKKRKGKERKAPYAMLSYACQR